MSNICLIDWMKYCLGKRVHVPYVQIADLVIPSNDDEIKSWVWPTVRTSMIMLYGLRET
jgi:hypothetical protein